MRNRGVQNTILQMSQYEYLSFAPSAISGVPSSVQVSQTYTARLTGDLTVRGAPARSRPTSR